VDGPGQYIVPHAHVQPAALQPAAAAGGVLGAFAAPLNAASANLELLAGVQAGALPRCHAALAAGANPCGVDGKGDPLLYLVGTAQELPHSSDAAAPSHPPTHSLTGDERGLFVWPASEAEPCCCGERGGGRALCVRPCASVCRHHRRARVRPRQAAHNLRWDVCSALLGAGAQLEQRNALHGRTPIGAAAPRKAAHGVEVIRQLLRAKAEVNVRDNNGATPLMAAVRSVTRGCHTSPAASAPR
jgi:hypothetical protein